MTPIQLSQSERAERAKQLLSDVVLKEAFAEVRAGLVSQLEAASASDRDIQHEIALMLKLLQKLRGQLERYIQDGTVVKYRAEQDAFVHRMLKSIRA